MAYSIYDFTLDGLWDGGGLAIRINDPPPLQGWIYTFFSFSLFFLQCTFKALLYMYSGLKLNGCLEFLTRNAGLFFVTVM